MTYPRVHGPHEYAGMTADELRCELVRRDAAAREFIAARELLCKQIDTLTKNLAKAEQKLQKQRSSRRSFCLKTVSKLSQNCLKHCEDQDEEEPWKTY